MINHVVEALLDESLAALSEHVDPYANVQNHLVNTVEMLTNTAIGPIYRAVIAEIPAQAIAEGQSLNLPIVATDPNNDNLTFSAIDIDQWCSVWSVSQVPASR